ncbi:hypothetical protein WICMUC_000912 [Wickerhamomyces mucosus]|uniref:Ubiquitin carboxyl-terminal hydrolase n=1 Tax=Wickerhamomyces mucosus TaxID=1378264 RepID=A0A9P8TI16_9ASCO|nr:hypothetical protein WICMUC_000912 [Wickerhamomyces mucosus]
MSFYERLKGSRIKDKIFIFSSFISISILVVLVVSIFIKQDITLIELKQIASFKLSFINNFLRKFNLPTGLIAVLAIALPLIFSEKGLNFVMDSFRRLGGQSSVQLGSRRRYRQNVDNETLELVLKKGGNIGGLVNDGNTCFMNSVLQSLSSCNTLVDYLNNESIDKEGLLFSKAFKSLISKLNGKHFRSNEDYKTDPLLKTMAKTPNKNFLLGYNQEDAQEFFQTIMNELESDFKKIIPNDKQLKPIDKKAIPEDAKFGIERNGELGEVYIPASQIDPNLENVSNKFFKYNLLTPMDGLSAERIGCLRCGEMGGIRYSVISGLSLNLPTDNYTSLSLTELLQEWTKPEIIEGVDCNRCGLQSVLTHVNEQFNKLKAANSSQKFIELYQQRVDEIAKELEKPIIDDKTFKRLHTKNMLTKTSKTKQILISRPPPVLAIHINRSVFDPRTYTVRKNNASVVFPLNLDMDQFVADPENINTDARLPLSKKTSSAQVQQLEEPESVETLELNQEDEKLEPSTKQKEMAHADFENNQESKDMDSEVDSDQQSSQDDELFSSDSDEVLTPPPNSQLFESQKLVELELISGPLVYELRSVINHYGTHNYGHYIAFRKHRGVWWRTSDESVDIVDEDEVLKTPGVFMLFYELKSLSEEIGAKLDRLDEDSTTIENNNKNSAIEDHENEFIASASSSEKTNEEERENQSEEEHNEQIFQYANL